jgi:hypothetical protein
MATATRPELESAQRFVDALGAADWEAVRALLAEDVHLRGLVPARPREEKGATAVVERFRYWSDDLDDLRLLDSEVEPMTNQVRVRYRLSGTDRDEGRVVVEQQCYLTVEDGLITKINSVSSEFQPTDSLH